jgi:peptide/nickel transport system permease protein
MMAEIGLIKAPTDEQASPSEAIARKRARVTRSGRASILVGSGMAAIFVGAGVLSLIWTPYPTDIVDVANRLAPPGTDGHLLGTDGLGRDVLSVVMAGAWTSISISVISTALSLIPGALIGLLVAAMRPTTQSVVTRFIDMFIAFPTILIALLIATSRGVGSQAAVVAIVLSFVPIVARVALGPARQVLALPFIEAAYSYGRSRWFVLWRHVLPNVAPLLIVQASLLFASAILMEAGLAYLGVGTQPPTPSLGRSLTDAQLTLDQAPYLAVFPGLAICIAVLGVTILGDGLRSRLDPRQLARGD